MQDEIIETMTDESHNRKYLFLGAIVIAILLLWIAFVMVVNSKKPEPIVLKKMDQTIKGMHFIKTNQALIKQMRENWMPNDILWPTVLLDNMPNFQIGQLEVIRYNIRVLRDNLSRMRTTDKLDPYAEEAFTSLSNDPYKWWFPSAESKWRLSYEKLDLFAHNLTTGKSHFYPRSDNLIQLLEQHVSLMGGVNTRLINAPRDIRNTISIEEQPKNGTGAGRTVEINIPWRKIDDNFYYAQGVSYALYESFKAIRTDFMNVLIDKNSLNLMDKIIEDLRRCNFEPLIVTNGSPASIFANHSLNLSGVFNDARQKINSLTLALKQG